MGIVVRGGDDREAIDWDAPVPGAAGLRADFGDIVERDFARFSREDFAAVPADDALPDVEGEGFR